MPFKTALLKEVGMSGFEPPISRPPDAHFNRTKLHPELDRKNMNLFQTIVQFKCFYFVDLYGEIN